MIFDEDSPKVGKYRNQNYQTAPLNYGGRPIAQSVDNLADQQAIVDEESKEQTRADLHAQLQFHSIVQQDSLPQDSSLESGSRKKQKPASSYLSKSIKNSIGGKSRQSGTLQSLDKAQLETAIAKIGHEIIIEDHMETKLNREVTTENLLETKMSNDDEIVGRQMTSTPYLKDDDSPKQQQNQKTKKIRKASSSEKLDQYLYNQNESEMAKQKRISEEKRLTHRNTMLVQNPQGFLGLQFGNQGAKNLLKVPDMRKESIATINSHQISSHYAPSQIPTGSRFQTSQSPYTWAPFSQKQAFTSYLRVGKQEGRGSILSNLSKRSGLSSMTGVGSVLGRQNTILDAFRMKQSLIKNAGGPLKERNMLEQLVDPRTQKIVVNPSHEYFSSSHADVFQNRLSNIAKVTPYNDQVSKVKTVKEMAAEFESTQSLKLTVSKWMPYERRVQYKISGSFEQKFKDVGYRVFNLMMQDNEELRRRHQEQPFETTTSTLVNQHDTIVDFDSIITVTRRSDLIVTNTLCISLIPRKVGAIDEAGQNPGEIHLNVFPPLESESSKSDQDEEEEEVKQAINDQDGRLPETQHNFELAPVLHQVQSLQSQEESNITLYSDLALDPPIHYTIQHQRQKSFREKPFSNSIKGLRQLFRSTGDYVKAAIRNHREHDSDETSSEANQVAIVPFQNRSEESKTIIQTKQKIDSIFEKSPREPNRKNEGNFRSVGGRSISEEEKTPRILIREDDSPYVQVIAPGLPQISNQGFIQQEENNMRFSSFDLTGNNQSRANLVHPYQNGGLLHLPPEVSPISHPSPYQNGGLSNTGRILETDSPLVAVERERFRVSQPILQESFQQQFNISNQSGRRLTAQKRKTANPAEFIQRLLQKRITLPGQIEQNRLQPRRWANDISEEEENVGVNSGRRVYRRRTIERKKKQVQDMNIQQAQDFFQGKFYSSDEDQTNARGKKKKRGDNQILFPINGRLNRSQRSSILSTAINGYRSRIRNSILKNQHTMISIGSRLRKASALSNKLSTAKFMPSRPTFDGSPTRRVAMLSNREKNQCIQEDLQDMRKKAAPQSKLNIAMSKKEFQQDHQAIYAKFLEKIVQAKEKRNKMPTDIEKDDKPPTGELLGKKGQAPQEDVVEAEEEENLSDLIPSSLESDYEQIKFEMRKDKLQSETSSTFAILSSDVRDSTHKNHFNIQKLRVLDQRSFRVQCRWSGPDVLAYSLTNLNKANRILRALNSIRIWPKRDRTGCHFFRRLLQLRAIGKKIISHKLFNYFMLLCVILNTVVLSLDSHQDYATKDLFTTFNTVFTCMFATELLMKLGSLGSKRFLKDPLNAIDAVIVIMSVVELAALNTTGFGTQSKSSISAFRVIRIFRVMRVLRMIRLLRQLSSMQIIIAVMSRAIKSFLYIAILLFVFLFIFTILGMQIFGNLNEPSNLPQPMSRANFDNFNDAFVTMFIVLTMTNWHVVLYDTMYFTSQSVGGQDGVGMRALAALYYIVFILIGNFILLNLFLAVLIDSFLKEGTTEQASQKQEANQKRELETLLHQKKKLVDAPAKTAKRDSNTDKELKKSFVRRQTLSVPLFKLLTKIRGEQQSPREATEIQRHGSSSNSIANAITAVKRSNSVIQRSGLETENLLSLLVQQKLVDGGSMLSGKESTLGSNYPVRLDEELGIEERAQIVQILTKQINYEMGFLTNQNLIELSQGILPLALEDSKDDTVNIFKATQCERVVFVFSKRNSCRQFAMRLIRHRYFDRFIITFIVLSSIKLAMETYYIDVPLTDPIQRGFQAGDVLLTAIFTSEAILKMLSYGVIVDQGSYFRQPENLLDFFIVATSLADNILQGIDTSSKNSKTLSQLKVLRLLRTLRPLRIVTHSQSMQMLISTLFSSIPGIANVVLLLLVVYLMFAILGDSLFSNRLIYCSSAGDYNQTKQYQLVTAEQCLKAKGVWVSQDQNYDTVLNGILTLLVASSLNNWDQLMYMAVDSSGENSGPIQNSVPGFAYFYIAFILVGNFFFHHFLFGVLFLNFKTVQQMQNSIAPTPTVMSEGKGQSVQVLGRTRTQQEEDVRTCWRDIQRLIVTASRPDMFDSSKMASAAGRKNGGTIRFKLQRLLSPGGKLDLAMTVILTMNTIQMGLYYTEGSLIYNNVLDDINIAFTVMYTIEAGLKLWAYGCGDHCLPRYFNSNWNRFDFIIVLTSITEIIVENVVQTQLKSLRAVPQIIRLLRVLRITRILRLIGKYEGLQALITTVIFSMPQLFSVLALLVILLFVFAILGVYLFRDVVNGSVINPNGNGYMGFTNFGLAMLIMYRQATGEDWSNIMQDTLNPANCAPGTDCVSHFSVLFFVGFNIICTYMMLNLFVLIALEQFDRYYLPKDNIMARFRRDLQSFQDAWANYCEPDPSSGFVKMKDSRIPAFLKALRPPLGLSIDSTLSSIAQEQQLQREVLRMGIKLDSNGFVHFHELLYRVMRRLYGTDPLLQELDMQLFELITQHKIQQKVDLVLSQEQRKGASIQGGDVGGSSRNSRKVGHSDSFMGLVLLQTGKINQQDGQQASKRMVANPFMNQMTAKWAFKAWLCEARGQSADNTIEVTYEVCEDVLIPADDEVIDGEIKETESESGSSSSSSNQQSNSSSSSQNEQRVGVAPINGASHFVPRDSIAILMGPQVGVTPSSQQFLQIPNI